MVSELTNAAMIEVLEDADKFACDALTAYIHKMDMLDCGSGRFKGDQTFMDAVSELQSKLRILATRLKNGD